MIVSDDIASRVAMAGACHVPRIGTPVGELPHSDLMWVESRGVLSDDEIRSLPVPLWSLGHSGTGSGDGYGSGFGDGYGYGSGSGFGDGYGHGDGTGYGDGSGYGDGDGDGSGSGHGYGSGDGDGSGGQA